MISVTITHLGCFHYFQALGGTKFIWIFFCTFCKIFKKLNSIKFWIPKYSNYCLFCVVPLDFDKVSFFLRVVNCLQFSFYLGPKRFCMIYVNTCDFPILKTYPKWRVKEEEGAKVWWKFYFKGFIFFGFWVYFHASLFLCFCRCVALFFLIWFVVCFVCMVCFWECGKALTYAFWFFFALFGGLFFSSISWCYGS